MGLIHVGFSNDILPQHPLTSKEMIDEQTSILGCKLQTVSFFDYLKNNGQRNNNRQQEIFIIKTGGNTIEISLEDLQEKISNKDEFELLGVSSIGNKFQTVKAAVQGHNFNDSNSGFERPIVAEGPHMILCLYAYDLSNKLRIFRTLQLRNGQVFVDTIRGFADSTTLENGEVLYNLEKAEAQIYTNITKVIKDEGGQKLLNIKKITYLGAPIVNSSFVTSRSATFAVEIDYKTFQKFSQVITADELKRREEEFRHEGLTEFIIDLSVPEYFAYKLDTTIIRDNAADGPSDIVVQYYFIQTLMKTI